MVGRLDNSRFTLIREISCTHESDLRVAFFMTRVYSLEDFNALPGVMLFTA